MTYDSTIFESLLDGNILENTAPRDITESVGIDLDDETIDKARCSLRAWGIGNENGMCGHENCPTKALQVFLEYPSNNLKVEVFLDPNTCDWSSCVNGTDNRLSPEQMQTFFQTRFFGQLRERLEKTWVGEEYSALRNSLNERKYKIDFENVGRKEEQSGDGELNEIETRTHKVKLGIPNEKDASGKTIRSSSGRKLINFSDSGVVKGKEEEAYYSWPGGMDDKHVFKWSRWNNWKNQRPWIRMRFVYGTSSMYNDVISLSLTPFEHEDKNRGFKTANISLIPAVQYLSPEEAQQIMSLSIVRKFMKVCVDRIEKVLSIPDEEIFKKINRPDKCTLEDIRKTKSVFKNSLKAVRENRVDTFVYTN